MSDEIRLRGVRARGHHGVFAHERRDGQDFVVDLVLSVDTRRAAASDDLADTVDYGSLAQRVVAAIEGEPLDLIEALAQRIADDCLALAGVHAVEVVVHKPQAPIPVPFDDVAVVIRRVRTPPRRAAFSLGANLGDPAKALQGAVDLLGATIDGTDWAVSSVYRTAAVGGPEQPDYLNAVLVVTTAEEPEALLAAAQAAEQAWGRTREVRWGPRTLDVDLLAVGGEVRATPALLLPHPRAHERSFVLVPWSEADPAAVLPGHGPVAGLAAPRAADPGIARLADLRLRLPGARRVDA